MNAKKVLAGDTFSEKQKNFTYKNFNGRSTSKCGKQGQLFSQRGILSTDNLSLGGKLG